MTRRGGGTGKGRPAFTHADFLARVVVREDGCWGWRGRSDSKGYSRFTGSPSRWQRAHIYSYEHYVGPVPAGMVLDHFKCDQRWCFNYEHVRPETSGGNTLRGKSFSAVNARKKTCPHCGGPYSYRRDGRRYCRTLKNYRQRQRRMDAAKL